MSRSNHVNAKTERPFGAAWFAAMCFAAFVALAAAFAPAASAQNLVNGDFEGFDGCGRCYNGSNYKGSTEQLNGKLSNGQIGGTYAGWSTTAGYAFILTASQAINGFDGPAGTLQLWSPSNGGAGSKAITASPAGGSFFAIDPSYPTVGGVLYQTLTGLVTGATYTVSFYAAAGQQKGFTLNGSGFTYSTETWTLNTYAGTGISGTPVASTSAPAISVGDKAFSGWVQQSLDFMATSATMTLSFLASSNVTSAQPPFALLDGVSVTKSTTVPEPSALALLATGVAGMALLRRRRARG